VGFRWFGRLLEQAREREAIIAELEIVGVDVWRFEPTPLGSCVQALPSPVANWTQRRLRDSLLTEPTSISACDIREDLVGYVLKRLKRFPVLQTVDLEPGQFSEATVTRIRESLVGVEVEVEVEPFIGFCALCDQFDDLKPKPTWLVDRSGRQTIRIETDDHAQRVVRQLAVELEIEDPAVRESAARWLGVIGPRAKEAVPALMRALEDPDHAVRNAAYDAIMKIVSMPNQPDLDVN
jgi:hypothetical protein